jgi:hypothetical protein
VDSGNGTTDRPANEGAAVASLGLLPGILIGVAILLLLLGLSYLYSRLRNKRVPQIEIGMDTNHSLMIENPVHKSVEEKESELSNGPLAKYDTANPIVSSYVVPMALGEWGPDYDTDNPALWDQNAYYVAHQTASQAYEMPAVALESCSHIAWHPDVYGDSRSQSPRYSQTTEGALPSHARNRQIFFSQNQFVVKHANQLQTTGAYEYEEFVAGSIL